MPDLYDGWEDDVRLIVKYPGNNSHQSVWEARARLRAAFTPHVHDWRWMAITPRSVRYECQVRCIAPGCGQPDPQYAEISTYADLPKYDGPDPLGGEK